MFLKPFGCKVYRRIDVKRLVCAVLLASVCFKLAGAAEVGVHDPGPQPTESEQLFLDRLMVAESGNVLFAANPKSSALGPFQFLASTFLDVVQRNFPELTQGRSQAVVLQMRADLKISRDVALRYTRENAASLSAQGVTPTPANLRLAFFAGAAGALKVITAKSDTPVSSLLSASAREANPFLNGMTAGELLQRSEREASGLSSLRVATIAKGAPGNPKIKVACNLQRASCRKWLALATKRQTRKETRSSSPAQDQGGSALSRHSLAAQRMPA
jgi:hypothetical protein